MKMHKLAYLMAGTLVLGTTLGCSSPDQTQVSNNNITATPTAIEASDQAKTQKPLTKTGTISVEGEKTPITLKLYDEYSDLFSTYYPEKDFVPEGASSGEGTGVRFITNFGGTRNDNAYVNVSFLNSFKTLGQVRNFVNGKQGLIATNGWQVVSREQNIPYSWAKEKIVFTKQGNQNVTGAVYIGQQNGKAFYVVEHYPAEYGDGFAPRANLILSNLQVGG